jgi:hypothetical protein
MAHMEGVSDLGLVHGVILPVVTACVADYKRLLTYLGR